MKSDKKCWTIFNPMDPRNRYTGLSVFARIPRNRYTGLAVYVGGSME